MATDAQELMDWFKEVATLYDNRDRSAINKQWQLIVGATDRARNSGGVFEENLTRAYERFILEGRLSTMTRDEFNQMAVDKSWSYNRFCQRFYAEFVENQPCEVRKNMDVSVIDQYACADDLTALVRSGESKIRMEYEDQAAAVFRSFQRIHYTLRGLADQNNRSVSECFRRITTVGRFKEMTLAEFEQLITPGKSSLSVFIHKFYPELR